MRPEEDLQPWFSWFAATDAELPEGASLECKMLGDHACIRILMGGTWTAETRDGAMTLDPGAEGKTYYFGPQSKAMPIAVTGSFKVVTIHLGAGAASALGGPSQQDMVDRIVEHRSLVGHGELATRFDPDAGPEQWYRAFAAELRTFMQRNGTPRPDPVTLAFEDQSLTNPAMVLHDFAETMDISVRTLERLIRKDYGLTPKQVMRRARALDLASALLGVAMDDDEAEMRLRYYDQSHQIREMKHFFGMTPKQLRDGGHPLLRLNLEIRQTRRISALGRLPDDAPMPWRDPGAEPV